MKTARLHPDHPEHLYLTDAFVPAHNSVLAQGIVYGALVRGPHVFIIDAVKGGADFKFAEDRCLRFASTEQEAAAVMKYVYAEVRRRATLNAEHGVAQYTDLPEPPPHIVVLVDELTSLLGKSEVPGKSDDSEVSAERAKIETVNRAKNEIGTFAGNLAREARSAGVTLILGTQKLAAKTLDTIPGGNDLKTNLSRLLLGKAPTGDKQSALRPPFDVPDYDNTSIPRGRGIWEPVSAAVPEWIQVWFATADTPREEP